MLLPDVLPDANLFQQAKIGNWVFFQRHHLTSPKPINHRFTWQGRKPQTTTTAKPTNKTKQKTSQMIIWLTRECIVSLQGGKHSACRHFPISLRSYQWLRGTWTMTLYGCWCWLACDRLFKTLEIYVLLRLVSSKEIDVYLSNYILITGDSNSAIIPSSLYFVVLQSKQVMQRTYMSWKSQSPIMYWSFTYKHPKILPEYLKNWN